MAQFYTDLTSASTDAKDRVSDGSKASGNVFIARASYTLLGTEAATDVLDIVKLPEGCVVIPALSKVILENPGTALVLDIGDDDATTAVDPDRYADGITCSSGGEVSFGSAGVAAQTPYKLQAQSTIQATVMTATSLTADQEVVFLIAYSAQA